MRFDNDFDEKLKEFVSTHAKDDPQRLLLKYTSIKKKDPEAWEFAEFAILQLMVRKKYSSKLHGWIVGEHPLLFPSSIAGEQSSHEYVARYHAKIVTHYTPKPSSLLDLTGGLGIDFMTIANALSQNNPRAVAIEMDPEKCNVLAYNVRHHVGDFANVVNAESIGVLKDMAESGEKYDLVFVDPARRDISGGRLFDPTSCSPNIIENKELLFKVAQRVLVKNSPMLDISESIRMFGDVSRIFVISVRNECKEVLVEMSRDSSVSSVITVDIDAIGNYSESTFNFEEVHEKYSGSFVNLDEIKRDISEGYGWLYEPPASMMKVSPWGALSRIFCVKKMSRNCHVFYSRECISDFPGRRIKIDGIIDKKGRKALKGESYNVVSRNYTEKADKIASSLKVRPSDYNYIYGVTVESAKGKESPLLLRGKTE